jgi:hypothetical protein
MKKNQNQKITKKTEPKKNKLKTQKKEKLIYF